MYFPTRPRPRPRPRHVWPLLVAALAVAGCSSTASTASAPAPARAVSSASVPPAPRATKAVNPCSDADCQTVVHGTADIPLDPRFGVRRFSVTFTRPDQVTFEVGRPRFKHMRALMQGTGYLSLAGGLTVVVDSFKKSGAVLRFSPTAVTVHTSAPTVTDKNNDKGSATQAFLIDTS